MTEYNYFCWAEEFNDKDSFQQKRYRIFNVEVSKEEYDKVKKIYNRLEFDRNESYETRFKTAFKKMWYSLDNKGKQEYLDIPHFNKEGFKFITGIDVNEEVQEMTVADIEKLVGKKVKIIK